MPNKELGIADPIYDALRVRSGQSIAPDLGGGSFGAGGIENKIYVWHADGSTIDLFNPDEAGLILAIAAAATGDTIWLPSIPITLSSTLTVSSDDTIIGIDAEKSILVGNVINNGILSHFTINGQVTNNNLISQIHVNVDTGTGITQTNGSAGIDKCRVTMTANTTYGIDISDGSCFYSTVSSAGGSSIGVYCHGSNAEIFSSRFAGHVGGKIEQAYIVSSCQFYGSTASPSTTSHGLIHATTGLARITNSTFICASANSYGAYITATGLTLTDCAWNSIYGLADITYGTGDRSPLNHTHTNPAMVSFVEGDVSNPPTEAEIEGLCGEPTTLATFILRDTSTGRFYFVVSNAVEFAYSPFITPASAVATFALAGAPGLFGVNNLRAIYYNGFTYYGYVNPSGDVAVQAYNNSTLTNGTAFALRNALGADNHDTPALLIRDSDKRLIAWYSAHNGANMYQRISTNPEDVSAWGTEATIESQLGGSDFTYPYGVQLTDEVNDPIYLFWRTPVSTTAAWWYSKSTDGGATWAARTELYESGTGRSGYITLAQNGNARIDFAVVNGHPIYESNCYIYHFYYTGGAFYKSDGTAIGHGPPFADADLTLVYNTGDSMYDDIAIDGTGKPVIGYTNFPSHTDHRFRYARWTGSAWDTHEIVAAGGPIATDPANWTRDGAFVLDSVDPSVVYASVFVGSQWELIRYTTSDGGTTWSSTALTALSASKNIFPTSPKNRNTNLKILWSYGTYVNFDDFSTAVYGGR